MDDSNSTETEATESAQLGLDETQELIKRGLVLTEMLKSERFTQFVQCNFDLRNVIDDEEKTITFQVIEVPESEVMRRVQVLARVAGLSHTKDKAPVIQVATEADLKAVDAAAKKAGVIV